MISVTEAQALIEQYASDFGVENVALHNASGRILECDVYADRDFPPYDRVAMDGIAICMDSFDAGMRHFSIEKVQAAGAPQEQLEQKENCIEVMTGAVLPLGTDVVIPYEDCIVENGTAEVLLESVRLFQNVHRKGTDSKAGQLLIQKGERITSAMIGIMATVGLETLPVKSLPKIAVCSTGDELVAINAVPQAQQIRQSNSYMLAAALQAKGLKADCFHLKDEKETMKAQLYSMLVEYDVLMFSGAVSKGKYDFLPEVLAESGVQTIFHRVAQRPGKPMLFGKAPNGTVIFGFPGNPVSTLVCYHVFFNHWLHHSLQIHPTMLSAQLACDYDFKPMLALHLLVKLHLERGVIMATPCPGAGSGDLVTLSQADAILSLPAEHSHFEKGADFPLRLLRQL